MSLTDDLYRDIILDHFKSPRNPGRLEKPDVTSQGANPFCGDELELTLALEGTLIQDIRISSKGCSISQASASMMTEAVKGKTLKDAEGMIGRFKATMLENAPWEPSPDMEDLEALEGVKKYPVRIKCAILSWNTLLEGIQAYRKGEHQATHVEGEEGSRPDLAFVLEGSAPSPQEKPADEAAQDQKPIDSNSQELVREALKRVIDPELNLNIVDLGLIYGIEVKNEGEVKVTYTLTSPGCPLGPVIQGQITSTLERLPWITGVEPHLVWKPPWDPRSMASEEVKSELGIW